MIALLTSYVQGVCLRKRRRALWVRAGDAKVLEGHAFVVEAAVSRGGRDLKPGINVYRFANRIPLLFEVRLSDSPRPRLVHPELSGALHLPGSFCWQDELHCPAIPLCCGTRKDLESKRSLPFWLTLLLP